MQSIIIEKRDIERDYGFNGTQAIIDHPKYGRILIQDGYGGETSIEGGCVRWKHGMINKLHDNDTFETLDADWNDYTSTISVVEQGYDSTRPIINISGHAVAQIAKSISL